MPVEIEAKMAVDSHEGVRARLRELGARLAGERLEVNTFFDTEEGSLRAADEGLRLRAERPIGAGQERHVLTYKGPRQVGVLKSREELEVYVSAGDVAAELLQRLGYLRTLSFEKRRESWELDGCKVELDTLPHLGAFVEIEGPGERAVLTVREKLGLSDRPIIKASYIALIMNHLGDDARTHRDVTFS